MKKLLPAALAFLFAVSVTAMDYKVDLRTDLLYTTYINNETYDILSVSLSPTAVSAYEKINLSIKKKVDAVKLNFDARFYVYPMKQEFEYVVDNAYMSMENGPFVAYFGKQRIKWGTGYTWNPTDLLQPAKNILNPTEDLEGFYALRAEYSGFFTPSLIISIDPTDAKEHFGKNFKTALQIYKLVGSADIFLNAVYRQDELQSLGAAVSWDVDWFILNLEGAAIRYMDSGLSLLRTLGEEKGNAVRCRYLAGVSKTLTDSSFITLEYYRNEWGLTNEMFADFIKSLKISPEMSMFLTGNTKRDYFSFNFSYVWYDKIGFNLAAIYGADDGNIILYPMLSYVESTNWDIGIALIENLAQGEKHEGYYTMPFYNAVEIRVNGYF